MKRPTATHNPRTQYQTAGAVIVALLVALTLSANNPSVTLSVPSTVERFEPFLVEVHSNGGGSEGVWPVVSGGGIGLVRGWHDHCGWCDQPCLVDGEIWSCTDSCGPYLLSCQWSSDHEFSGTWYGTPTWEMEAAGCGEAVLSAEVLGGSHEGPYPSPEYSILVLGGIEAVAVTDIEVACIDEEVTFDASQSCGGLWFAWDYGDTRVGYGEKVKHAYAESGFYTITLTAGDPLDEDEASVYVNVLENCAIVSGAVTDADDGHPLAQATVLGVGTTSTHTTKTDSEGDYTLRVTGGDTYNLTASKAGYLDGAHPPLTLDPGDEEVAYFVLHPEFHDPVDENSLLGDQTNNINDPVNPAIGNFTYSKTLFGFPGVGIGFAFRVHYNSRDNAYDGPLGFGWTHKYNVVLTAVGDDVTLKFGDGHEEFFHFNSGAGTYSAVGCHPSVSLENRTPDGWVANLGAGITYEFDAQGRLEAIKDLSGNALTFAYSTSLDRITDTAGRQIDFSYTGHRISTITSPYKTGDTVSFSYDGNGDLIGITDPRGSSWVFSYDGAHRMSTEVDALGITVLSNTYDGSGWVVEQRDAANQPTTFSYTPNAGGLIVEITPPSGNAVTHRYNTAHNLVRVVDGEDHTATFAHDDNGQPIDATDKMGQAAALTFDENANLTSLTDRLGNTTDIEYGDANFPNLATEVTGPTGSSSEFTYDANGNMVWSLDPAKSQVIYTRNSLGQVTELQKLGLYYENDTWIFTYSPDGLLLSQEDPYSAITSYEHDAAGRVNRITLPDSLGVLERTYDDGGKLVSTTSPMGFETTYGYDANGLLTTVTFVPTSATTTYSYDTLHRLETVTDALGGVTTFAYDLDSNLVSVTDPDSVSLEFEYDSRNQIRTTTTASGQTADFVYDAAGRLLSVTDALSRTWERRYDAAGRLIELEDPNGHTSSTVRDAAGRPISITNPTGEIITARYDGAGRPQGITAPDGASVAFGHDRLGNLVGFTDERGGRWDFSFDSLGRLVEGEDPDGAATTHTYDALGRRTSTTTRNGDLLEYQYDLDGRLVEVSLPGPTTLTFSYSYSVSGQQVTVTGPEGPTILSYDKLGRLVEKTDVWGNTMAFAYTAASRVDAVTYPGNHVVDYAYDTFGRLQTITDWFSYQTNYSYDALDRVSRVDLPNGAYSTYGYNERGLLNSLVHYQPGGVVLWSDNLGYDARGQITSETIAGGLAVELDDIAANSSYDPVNRVLTTETDTTLTTYVFDDDGNLVTKTSGSDVTSYAYDALERLVSVDDGSVVTTYTYDARGSRIAKVHDGGETRYLRDGGQIWATFNGAGVVRSYNIHAGALVYSLDAGGQVQVYHGDPRGSVVAVSDSSGTIVGAYAYDPYGRVLASSGGLDNEHGFVGMHGVLTDENSLVHMQARFYDPAIRRFLTEDPLGIVAGANVYVYVAGDPVGRIDPKGLSWELLVMMAEGGDLMIAAELFEIEAAAAVLSEASTSVIVSSLEGAVLTGAENAAVYFTGEVAAGSVSEWSAAQLYSMGSYQTGGVTVTQSSTNAIASQTTGLLTTLGADVTTLGATTISGAVVVSVVGGVVVGRYIGSNVEVSWRDPMTGEVRHGNVDQFTENYLTVYTTEYYTKDDEQLDHQKSIRKLLARYGLSYADYLKVSAKLDDGAAKTPLLESFGLTPALWDVIANYVQP